MTRKGEQTREHILTEAGRLFQQRGFRATSLSDLLAATGLKKGALYFHFASKDEIALAVLERARRELAAFLEGALQGPTPAACLKAFFERMLSWQQEQGFVGGCIFGNTALEMGDADERFARLVDEVFEDWIERLHEIVAAAQAAGELRRDLDAECLARHLVAVTEGGIMLARLKKHDQPLRTCFETLKVFLAMR